MEKISVPTYKQFLNALTVVHNGVTVLQKPLTTVAKPGGTKFKKIASPVNDLIRWTTSNETLFNEAVSIARKGATPRAKAAHTT